MSLLEKYLKGWSFRTNTPSLEPGATVNVFVTEYDPASGEGIAFVGDTELRVEEFDPEALDSLVAVRVVEFDAERSVGRGEFREVVGETADEV